MAKNLVFITSHVINHNIIREYKKYLNITNHDIVFCLDNSNNRFSNKKEPIQELEFYGEKVKCFLFDYDMHKQSKLPDYTNGEDRSFRNIMWYNCDYRFYYIKPFFPDYDYYWQSEYDIYCNGDSYEPFFNKYKDDTKDILISNFDIFPHNPHYCWSHQIKGPCRDFLFYTSLFPLTRLSKEAVDFLYEKRLEHVEIYEKSEARAKRWMPCENFCPTELLNNNFTGGRLDENISLGDWNIFGDDFAVRNNKLYHPIKWDYYDRIKKLEAENEALKRQIRDISINK